MACQCALGYADTSGGDGTSCAGAYCLTRVRLSVPQGCAFFISVPGELVQIGAGSLPVRALPAVHRKVPILHGLKVLRSGFLAQVCVLFRCSPAGSTSVAQCTCIAYVPFRVVWPLLMLRLVWSVCSGFRRVGTSCQRPFLLHACLLWYRLLTVRAWCECSALLFVAGSISAPGTSFDEGGTSICACFLWQSGQLVGCRSLMDAAFIALCVAGQQCCNSTRWAAKPCRSS